MTGSAFSENQLVEQPAIALFAELGWATVNASAEVLGAGGTLGRLAKTEVVLTGFLRSAIEQLNPALPPEAVSAALDEIARDRSAMGLAANRDLWTLLRDGVLVQLADAEHGGQRIERVRVVDSDAPANNHFLPVSQLTVKGALYTCRPDLVGFVNGLPWLVIELKKPGVPAR